MENNPVKYEAAESLARVLRNSPPEVVKSVAESLTVSANCEKAWSLQNPTRSKIKGSIMSQGATAAATTLVVRGGTLIDGTGKPPLENSAIVIEGERFKTVGKAGEISIPPGSEIIDATGKTVLPGFIDGHGHWEDWFGELYLHLGITTCVNIELYQDGPWILAQRDATNSGKIRGPRLWASGQALGTRQAEAVRESARAARGEISVSSAEEARAAVQKKKQDGYDIIKVNEFVPLNWLEFVTKEAEHLGMPVTGHSWDAIGSAARRHRRHRAHLVGRLLFHHR